jgi:DNA polymerase I
LNNSLIYGKSDIQGVVSVEDTGNGIMKIYTQNTDGEITAQEHPTDYWILTSEPQDKMSMELKGNGFYKYKNLFNTKTDYNHSKKYCYNHWKVKDKFFLIHDPKEAFMTQTGVTYYKGLKHDQVSVLSFDIETTTLEHTSDAKILLISNTYRDHRGNIERRMFCYDEYTNEKEFIEAWCAWVRQVNPSIIVGHNIFNFDLPYIHHIAFRSGIDFIIGREETSGKFNDWSSKFRKDASQFYEYRKFFAPGREIVDTFFLSIKYDISRKYESYGLKSIIKQENLEVKDRQFYDASQIRYNYKNPIEWEKIKQYALHDADDALTLWDLMGPSSFYMAQIVPRSLQEIVSTASGSQLNSIMIRAYLQDDHSLPKATDAHTFEGAISLGKPGVYPNCVRWDIASLYPSIMRQYKIHDPIKDPMGHFLLLTEHLAIERLRNKKLAKDTGDKYYDDLQNSQKIMANSLYGFLGAPGLLFNYPDGASQITAKGREILRSAVEWASGREYDKWARGTDKEYAP